MPGPRPVINAFQQRCTAPLEPTCVGTWREARILCDVNPCSVLGCNPPSEVKSTSPSSTQASRTGWAASNESKQEC